MPPHTLVDHDPGGGGIVSWEVEKTKKKDLRRQQRQRARQERAASLEQAGGLEAVGMEGMVLGDGARARQVPHASRGQIEPPIHSDGALPLGRQWP